MGIPVPGFLPKRARVGYVRGQSRAELVGVWKEAWRLVDSARSTDPEWAMEWSVRLNRSPLEKVPSCWMRCAGHGQNLYLSRGLLCGNTRCRKSLFFGGTFWCLGVLIKVAPTGLT